MDYIHHYIFKSHEHFWKSGGKYYEIITVKLILADVQSNSVQMTCSMSWPAELTHSIGFLDKMKQKKSSHNDYRENLVIEKGF